jgi:hypothetical protein
MGHMMHDLLKHHRNSEVRSILAANEVIFSVLVSAPSRISLGSFFPPTSQCMKTESQQMIFLLNIATRTLWKMSLRDDTTRTVFMKATVIR